MLKRHCCGHRDHVIAPTPILRAPIYDIHDAHLQQTLAESRQLCATPASTEPNDAQLAEAEASGGAPPSFAGCGPFGSAV